MLIPGRTSVLAGLATAIISLLVAVPANARVAMDRSATLKHASKGMPSVGGIAAKPLDDGFYLYAGAFQDAQADGVSAVITVGRSELAPAGPVTRHSLAEIAVQSADQQQIVEVGWHVDRAMYGNDDPHLFVFHWVNGNRTCYNTCGFTVNGAPSVKPGDVVPANTLQAFTVLNYNGDWWIGYSGEWIGHFPGTLWGGGFTRSGVIKVFGEVNAEIQRPCTDMGNGLPSFDRRSATISNVAYTNGPTVNLTVIETDRTLYSALLEGTVVYFGGQGTGTCVLP
jgi:hypothetical protein